jgi:hypothetical protein
MVVLDDLQSLPDDMLLRVVGDGSFSGYHDNQFLQLWVLDKISKVVLDLSVFECKGS